MSTETIAQQAQRAAQVADRVVPQSPPELAESWSHLERLRKVGLAGTRSGLPTIACYLASDLLSVAISLAAVRLVLAVTGLAPTFTQFDIRLAVGFTFATLILHWYQG